MGRCSSGPSGHFTLRKPEYVAGNILCVWRQTQFQVDVGCIDRTYVVQQPHASSLFPATILNGGNQKVVIHIHVDPCATVHSDKVARNFFNLTGVRTSLTSEAHSQHLAAPDSTGIVRDDEKSSGRRVHLDDRLKNVASETGSPLGAINTARLA